VSLSACLQEPADEEAVAVITSDDFTLRWQVDNQWDPASAVAYCTFTLSNQGEKTLDSTNWRLYYSQFPRQVIQAGDTAQYQVEHLSGDWFRLRPGPAFHLEPGQSVELSYQMSGPLLKETDAPLGPYLTLLQGGQEQQILAIQDYEIQPLDWVEKYADQKGLPIELPTAANRFAAHQGLSKLDTEQLLPLIPRPQSARLSGESLLLDASFGLYYEPGLGAEARLLAEQLTDQLGLHLPVAPLADDPSGRSIRLTLDANREEEGYALTLNETQIEIQGGAAAGVFYGAQSLLQLIPVADLSRRDGKATLPTGRIEDAPRFAYRGLHLDLGRNFQSRERVLKFIDLIATYKLNRLQLYLSEDEGWRLAIEELPELTEVGAKRGHTLTEHEHLHPSYGSGPSVDNPHGSGFFSREDFKAILRYAHARHVQVIPTFNFPAHARAAIVAMEHRYRRLMEAGQPEAAKAFRLIDPADTSQYSSAQAYDNNVVSVARPSTYRFYQTVLDDVAEMYQEAGVPFEFFHVGGDEVPSGAWAGSPQNRALLDSLPDIDDPRNLQVYFFDRTLTMLQDYRLQVGGWEEVALQKGTEGFVINPRYAQQGIIPYVWNTRGAALNLGYRMANAGYPVVICNVQNFYFDLAYNPAPQEPGLYWGGFVNTYAAWSFAPFHLLSSLPEDDPRRTEMKRLQPEARDNLLGVQAQLWSETIKGGDMLEYYTLPKLLGFAERAWAEGSWEAIEKQRPRQAEQGRAWNRFANTLGQRALPRLAYLFGGSQYRLPLPGVQLSEGELRANVAFPGLEIRYTTDGSEPSAESPRYQGPLKTTRGVRLRSFDAAGHHSRTVVVE